ncbi:unnamed protein product [Eruca vesicaria subsp. sativa]|uniref:DUF1677 family protein n=1 Tax=Eruca vesicaria subsp. sativa TaxID=29727 RepID=A0ABC8L4J0_ERUVS|nr:unnamed protein product [Eruca vesicaria subsp. sativa]
MAPLKRTCSDISHQISIDNTLNKEPTPTTTTLLSLSAISEVEDAKCECCGMSEECTPEYINRVRSKFSGKLICGLCAEAVEQEMEKMNNSSEVLVEKRREEAVHAHMSACSRFNRLGRSYPALYQAEAVKEILKKRSNKMVRDTKSEKGGLTRSSSCMPALAKELKDRTFVN